MCSCLLRRCVYRLCSTVGFAVLMAGSRRAAMLSAGAMMLASPSLTHHLQEPLRTGLPDAPRKGIVAKCTC